MVEDKKQVANIFIKFQVLHPSIYYNFTMIPYFVSGKFWIHFLDVSLIRWMGCNMKPTTTQLLRYILTLEFILITIVHKHSIKLDARMEHEMGHWGGFCRYSMERRHSTRPLSTLAIKFLLRLLFGKYGSYVVLFKSYTPLHCCT